MKYKKQVKFLVASLFGFFIGFVSVGSFGGFMAGLFGGASFALMGCWLVE